MKAKRERKRVRETNVQLMSNDRELGQQLKGHHGFVLEEVLKVLLGSATLLVV